MICERTSCEGLLRTVEAFGQFLGFGTGKGRRTRKANLADIFAAIFAADIRREGLYGVALAHGHDSSATAAMVQIADSMLRIGGADFRRCLRADPFSGCKRLHPMNERFARWLLMAHDLVSREMNCCFRTSSLRRCWEVRRPGVSLAASSLEEGSSRTATDGSSSKIDAAASRPPANAITRIQLSVCLDTAYESRPSAELWILR